MLNRHSRVSRWVLVSSLVAASIAATANAQSIKLPFRMFKGVRGPELVTQWSQVAALSGIARDPWKPQANDEVERGASFAVYPKVAPAVVVVRAPDGHGTGFVVDPEGWIVTNQHVIEEGELDPSTLTRKVVIYFGRLKDGFMEVIDQGYPAVVYKASEEKDLALLKLTAMPKELNRLPALRLAASPPPPGSDCVVIGHPAAGMLWTVRSGEVSGAGTWPREMIDVMLQRLALTGDDRSRLEDLCANAPQRKVLISSCGLNPGDSGSPLVNTEGEVVGVSFAIPSTDKEQGIHLDKFAYHVHLDELKQFLADRPDEPLVYVPDAWPPGIFMTVIDFDGNGTPDTLAFAATKFEPVTGLVLDLDEDSKVGQEGKSVGPIDKDNWDFEYAFQDFPVRRTFYDTDNDGTIDLILTDCDEDKEPDYAMQLQGGHWVSVKVPTDAMTDPALFRDKALQQRLEQFVAELAKQISAAPPAPAEPKSSGKQNPPAPPAPSTRKPPET